MIKYISIDIETTGLDPERHQVLEVGAIYDNGKGWDLLPRFRAFIFHDELVGDPVALEMNASLIAEINVWRDRMDGRQQMWIGGTNSWLCRPGAFKKLFDEWLKKNGIEEPVLAGKNLAGFDLPFLKKLGFPKYHRRTLDPAILYLDPDDRVPPRLSACLSRAGLPHEVTHRAVDDAMQVVQLIRKGLIRGR